MVEEANGVLAELTANLMRVTRGRGRPERILRHVVELAALSQRHFDAKRQRPRFLKILSVDDPRAGDNEHPVWYATDAILRGTLQIAASRLIRQIPQEAMGDDQPTHVCPRCKSGVHLFNPTF
jgi:hypothetical protein